MVVYYGRQGPDPLAPGGRDPYGAPRATEATRKRFPSVVRTDPSSNWRQPTPPPSGAEGLRSIMLGLPIVGTWFDQLFGESIAPQRPKQRPRPPSVGSGIQRGLGVGGRGLDPNQALDILKGLNPFQGPDVWQELLNLQDPSRYMMDPSELRQQAMSAARAQYNPLIRALQQQQTSTESRAGDYDERLRRMYADVERGARETTADVQRGYRGSREQTKDEYADLEQSIKKQYATSQQEQQKMMQELNIEAAAPDILPEQQADRDYFLNRARQERKTELSAQGMEERGDVGFARSGQDIARFTGAERRADLMGQLEELVQGYESQIGAHRTARSQAVEAGFGSLQSQAMEQAQAQAQQEFQNRMAMLQYERQLRGDEFSQLQQMQKGQEGLGAVESYRDIVPSALEFLQPLGGGEQEAQNVAESINAVLDSPLLGMGMIKPNSYQLAQIAMEEGKRRRLGPNQLAALRQIAQEYFR